MILSTDNTNNVQPAIKQELTSIQHLNINDDQPIATHSPSSGSNHQDHLNNNNTNNSQDQLHRTSPELTKVEPEGSIEPETTAVDSSDSTTKLASMIMQQMQPEPQNLHMAFDRDREQRDREDSDGYRDHSNGELNEYINLNG